MIDPNLALVTWLAQSAALTALVKNQQIGGKLPDSLIFCGMLPEGYKPEVNGCAITFACSGGNVPSEVPIISPRVQIECWAPQLRNQEARAVYGAVCDLIANKNNIDLGANGYILSSIVEVFGQDLTDPDTQWASVLGYFRLMLRN